MSGNRWHRLERIFAEAMAEPAGLRAGFLERTCGTDSGMRRELASLLIAAEEAGDFLAASALEVFARQVSREGWSVQPGDRIGSYTVDRRLGAGGMGEVWRARDERLGRDVAIKLLLPHASSASERVRALQLEARAAGTLNHGNVITVYDVGEHRGAPYLVTECLEGESLRARLRAGALSVDTALDVALQVARGLGAAHEHGIVHRDLKPENIFLTLDGRAKILDFGLAEQHDSVAQASNKNGRSADPTRSFVTGTVGYMAPEQVQGEFVDRRADIFALGVVLHEMLTGRQPFKPANKPETQMSPALSRLLGRCLGKSPDARFGAAAEVVSALESIIRVRSLPPRPNLLALVRRPVVMVGLVVLVFALAAAGWQWRVTSRVRWARTVAAPEVQRLLNQGDLAKAFLLARRALDLVPGDPLLKRLWLDVSVPAVVTTDPAGADVALAPYEMPTNSDSWLLLGRTPLLDARIPRGLFRLRITKAGFQSIEGTGSPGALARYRLDPVGAVPAGMVRVVGGGATARFGLVADLDDFWIDKFEVTNREFKDFVARGGYRRREYWREPFSDGKKALPWEEAILRFHDASGQPGPATWRFGTYPDGQADFPVGGVSWYEAAAYAAYVGKSLPTLYHWYQAAALARFADILTVSNFGGKGPAKVGSYHGLGPFGTYDMAGNVREWGWNEMNGGRFLLGGAWNDAMRMFSNSDVKGAFERAPGYGFRLAKYSRPLRPALTAAVRLEQLGRDVRKQKPVGDDVFEVYRRLYAYDRSALNVEVEQTSHTDAWQKQSVTLDAAYGGERLRVYLFLPENAAPPYQTVIFFPPGDASIARSSRDLSLAWGEPIVRSGRAFVYPIYKGTYERQTAAGTMGANEVRELRIAWSRDLGRCIDYLETRSDIDRTQLTFYAVGQGAAAVLLTALEPRLKLSVLQGSGIWIWSDVAPEIDAINYAPRIRIPTLMLNARHDFKNPVETAQRPLFDLLGTPPEQKKHTVLEIGHGVPVEVGAREILPWLDRYLSSVVH